MKPFRPPFEGPFFDQYAIGARLYRPGETRHNFPANTIAGVSLNARDIEAFFFNVYGQVLPLLPNQFELPALLRQRTIRREFATVRGEGLFSMKPARLNAMTASMRGEWVTYWLLDDSASFANCPKVWEAYVETELQAARHWAAEQCAAELRYRRKSDFDVNEHLPEQPSSPPDTESLKSWVDEQVSARLEELRTEHARLSSEDRQLSAWLRGDAGDPPLLKIMKGAA